MALEMSNRSRGKCTAGNGAAATRPEWPIHEVSQRCNWMWSSDQSSAEEKEKCRMFRGLSAREYSGG